MVSSVSVWGGKRNSCQEETDKDQHCHISYSMSLKIDIACHFSHLLKLCSSCLTSRYVPYKESSWRERMSWEWKRPRGKEKHSRTDRWFRSGSVQGIARPSQSNWAASPSHQGQGDGIINQLALSSLPSNTTLLPSLSLVCMPTTPSPSSQLITCLHVRDWSSANRRVMVSTPWSVHHCQTHTHFQNHIHAHCVHAQIGLRRGAMKRHGNLFESDFKEEVHGSSFKS